MCWQFGIDWQGYVTNKIVMMIGFGLCYSVSNVIKVIKIFCLFCKLFCHGCLTQHFLWSFMTLLSTLINRPQLDCESSISKSESYIQMTIIFWRQYNVFFLFKLSFSIAANLRNEPITHAPLTSYQKVNLSKS